LIISPGLLSRSEAIMGSDALTVLEAFEKALFAGEDIRPFFAEDAVCESSGQPPIGGRFEGREAIVSSFEQRLTGLGPGMQGEDVERVKFASADGRRAVSEIHERSWLPDFPDDVLEVRTCSVAHVEDGLITRLIDYTGWIGSCRTSGTPRLHRPPRTAMPTGGRARPSLPSWRVCALFLTTSKRSRIGWRRPVGRGHRAGCRRGRNERDPNEPSVRVEGGTIVWWLLQTTPNPVKHPRRPARAIT
jgi:hypothetical protein